jgi:flagellar motor switch/type III secretory pathway protein FliN
MRRLRFDPPRPDASVREIRWERQSGVVLAQACEIANRIRERLAAKLGPALEVSLHEAIVPSSALIAALLAEAELFEIDGRLTRAWLGVDSQAARKIVAAAFADQVPEVPRPWSPLETQVLLGCVRDIAESCEPLIGAISRAQASHDVHAALEASSLIAIRLSSPLDIEFDLLLAHDPAPAAGPALSANVLDDMELPVRAIAGMIQLQIRELMALEIGAILPMSRIGQAQLVVDQTKIAHGACGVIGGRLAFRIGTCNESQGV